MIALSANVPTYVDTLISFVEVSNDYSKTPIFFPFGLLFNAKIITTVTEPTEPYIFSTVPSIKVRLLGNFS